MFKKLLSKNLIVVITLIIVGAFIFAPKFLPGSKTLSQSKTDTKTQNSLAPTSSQNDSQTTSSDEGQKTVPSSQVQGTNTQKTTTKTNSSTQVVTPPNQTGSTTEAGDPVTHQVTLNIQAASYGNFTYKVDWVNGMTVWESLKKASDSNHFDVKAVWNQGFNSYYVSGIEGNNCSCWEYEVNGVKPSVGASVTTVNENDIITWKTT